MIWVLVIHLHVTPTDDIWSITGQRTVYVRQDACEAVKAMLLQLDMAHDGGKLDLECKAFGVVE